MTKDLICPVYGVKPFLHVRHFEHGPFGWKCPITECPTWFRRACDCGREAMVKVSNEMVCRQCATIEMRNERHFVCNEVNDSGPTPTPVPMAEGAGYCMARR